MARLITVLLLGLGLVAAGTSVAEAYSGDLTITSPAGQVASGTITVRGTNNTSSTVYADVYCDGEWVDQISPAPGAFSASVGSVTGPASCSIEDDYDGTRYATFTVAAPVTTVADVRVSTSKFYPLVHDGYRDSVRFHWSQNHAATTQIEVLSSSGAVVRSVATRRYAGGNDWSWNGKRNNGTKVGAGTYRIRVHANANTISTKVVVATGWTTRRFTLRNEGNHGAALATRGSCYATRDSYEQVADLDCWGGRFAKATYRFRIPAGARDVRGTVALMAASADICCRGRITKGWSHPTARSVVLWAKATGWRATTVNYVRVTYSRRVRI